MSLLLLYRPRTLAGTGVGGGGGWTPWGHKELIKLLWDEWDFDHPNKVKRKRKPKFKYYEFKELISDLKELRTPNPPPVFPMSVEEVEQRILEINSRLRELKTKREALERIIPKNESSSLSQQEFFNTESPQASQMGQKKSLNPALGIEEDRIAEIERRVREEEEILEMLMAIVLVG